jgi:hypothetical protein
VGEVEVGLGLDSDGSVLEGERHVGHGLWGLGARGT